MTERIYDSSQPVNVALNKNIVTIEEKVPFSKSDIWKIQTRYFKKRGIDAWTEDLLPDYITTNTATAGAFCEIAAGFLRDTAMINNRGPIYIIELGSGPGRFAFHFLKLIEKIKAEVKIADYRYIITDLSEKNMDFWIKSPGFAPYIKQGIVDFALFNMEKPGPLKLKISKERIKQGSLTAPFITIANYVFDTLIQDVFLIEDGQIMETLVSMYGPKDIKKEKGPDIMKDLSLSFEYKKIQDSFYKNSSFDEMLEFYKNSLKKAHLIFPFKGLRCIRYLKKLSKKGMLMISADKGFNNIKELSELSVPAMVRHGGCFSMPVNYHAIKMYCERDKGEAFCSPRHFHIDVGCFLFAEKPGRYVETKLAFKRFAERFGPNDIFCLKKSVESSIGYMNLADIAAYMSLNRDDPRTFAMFVPRLSQLIPDCSESEKEYIFELVNRVCEMYFPVADDGQMWLAFGTLMYELRRFEEAVKFFEKSIEVNSSSPPAVYNMAVCFRQMGDKKRAAELFDVLKEILIK